MIERIITAMATHRNNATWIYDAWPLGKVNRNLSQGTRALRQRSFSLSATSVGDKPMRAPEITHASNAFASNSKARATFTSVYV